MTPSFFAAKIRQQQHLLANTIGLLLSFLATVAPSAMDDIDLSEDVKPLMVTQVDDDDEDDDDDVKIVATKSDVSDANTDLTDSQDEHNKNDPTTNENTNEASDTPIYDSDAAIIDVVANAVEEAEKCRLTYPFPNNFPCPHPKDPTSFMDFYCTANNIHIKFLEDHLKSKKAGVDNKWRAKAFKDFCVYRRGHMQDLHPKEKEVVLAAMSRCGASKKGKTKNSMTTPNLSRWLCMFYGAYRSMDLKKSKSSCDDPIFFKIGNDKKKGYNQLKEICEVIAQTHNKKVHDDMKRRCRTMESIPGRKLRTELIFKVELVSCFVLSILKYTLVLTLSFRSLLRTFSVHYASIDQ